MTFCTYDHKFSCCRGHKNLPSTFSASFSASPVWHRPGIFLLDETNLSVATQEMGPGAPSNLGLTILTWEKMPANCPQQCEKRGSPGRIQFLHRRWQILAGGRNTCNCFCLGTSEATAFRSLSVHISAR